MNKFFIPIITILYFLPLPARAQPNPSREWGTYYFNSRTYVNAAATDIYGNVYIAGYTFSGSKFRQSIVGVVVSPSVATPGSFQDTLYQTDTATSINNVRPDAFLAKFNSAGVRQWATYYGGNDLDVANAIACDSAGNVYMAGSTLSNTAIATAGGHQVARGGNDDGFLVKFDSSGNRLWGTYIGGSGNDIVQAIAINPNDQNDIFIGGSTTSPNAISTVGSYQPAFAGGTVTDAFLAKFNSNGVRQWATYYGDTVTDAFLSLVCDVSGNVYAAGTTTSLVNIASPGSHQDTAGGGGSPANPVFDIPYIPYADAFLVKFSNDGQRIWGTYYGGNQKELQPRITFDKMGNNLILAGITSSANNIATPGSFQEQNYTTGDNEFNAFLAKFDTGGVRQWGTYYGGAAGIAVYTTGLSCDAMGNMYLSQTTNSSISIATPGSYQDTFSGGSSDLFLVKFGSTGSRIWGTYLGSGGNSPNDYSQGHTMDDSGNIYLLGTTAGSSNIATPGSFQSNIAAYPISPTAAHGIVPFLVKFYDCLPDASIANNGTQSLCEGDSIVLHTNNSSAQSYQWLKDGLVIPNASTTALIVTETGVYHLVVSNGPGCSDTSAADTVIVHPLPVVSITANGHVLQAGNGFSSYQWLLDGQVITGATGAVYTATQNGNYTVTVTDSNGCTATSAIHSVSDITGIGNVTLGATIHIYPNPVKDILEIKVSAPVSLYVYAIDGRLLLQEKHTKQINVKQLAPGMYLLKITDEKDNMIKVAQLVKSE